MEVVRFSTHKWLSPLSWLYGLGVNVRNELFDAGWLKSVSFPIPVINIGNLTVGGTGKTPHTEYLVRLLSREYRVAVLSRGYRRESSGYVLAKPDTPASQIGDEPWQMKQKFPHIYVAVDANRRRGITRLMHDKETRDVEVILLDDAYQHRYVKAGLNILLVNWHRPIHMDRLLPVGRLREPFRNRNRADIVVVSKCPNDVSSIDLRVMQNHLALPPFQDLFFSAFRYDTLRPLFSEASSEPLSPESLREMNVLLVSGIGCPKQMENELKPLVKSLKTLTFPDHHGYTPSNVKWAENLFSRLPQPRLVVTTEKDAARIGDKVSYNGSELQRSTYVLPIEVTFLQEQQESFNKKILNYVRANLRNRNVD
jgi:tetraacyldisaccharide 4'-kinase